MSPHKRHAFTLIELLIVAGIIAILAAIALPNFLEAQTRAKVARAQADQHSIATAMEAYAVDQNIYPAYSNPLDYALFAGEPVVFLPVNLTTPVAYLATLPPDPFPGSRTGLSPGVHHPPNFYRHDYRTTYLGKELEAGHVATHYRSLTGSPRAVVWTVWSFGPDLDDDHGIVLYDPTNGTLSTGDMMRFGP